MEARHESSERRTAWVAPSSTQQEKHAHTDTHACATAPARHMTTAACEGSIHGRDDHDDSAGGDDDDDSDDVG